MGKNPCIYVILVFRKIPEIEKVVIVKILGIIGKVLTNLETVPPWIGGCWRK